MRITKDMGKKVGLIALSAVVCVNMVLPSFAQSSVRTTSQNVIQQKIEDLKKSNNKQEEFNKGEIIVKYKDSKDLETVKMRIKNKIQNNIAKVRAEMPKTKKSISKNIDLLSVDTNEDVVAVAKEVAKDPDVEYAQPNYIYYTTYVPQDARYSEMWGLKNTPTGVDINAEKAWDITKGNSSVVIGVLDTGVDINHPELINNIYTNPNEIPGNGIDDDNNGYIDDVKGWDFHNKDNSVYDSADRDYHGTHVSGTIAARANTEGVIGVASNVKILPLKFINGNQGGSSINAIEGINYAKQMGVSIINCSWGGPHDPSDPVDQALYNAMRDSGILFLAAAGNDGADLAKNPQIPACYDLPNIVTVAAIGSDGKLASFSNYGACVEVAAPGVSILSTMPNNSYGLLNGTSMATPHVTGIAALIKSQFPSYTINQIADKIKDSAYPADTLKASNQVPNGLIADAYGAVRNCAGINFKDGSVSEHQIDLEWEPVAGTTYYEVWYSNIRVYAGMPYISFSGLKSGTNYFFDVIAKDAAGQVLAGKRVLKSTIPDGTGIGLKGSYYNDTNMNDLKLTRTENVDFDWGSNSPDATINPDTFSAKWQGSLQAKYSEEYTFYLKTKGIAKLWFNGSLLTTTSNESDTAQEVSGKITLEAGRVYPIEIEYFDNSGLSSIQFSWSSESQEEEIVPTGRLFPPEAWSSGNKTGAEMSIPVTATVVDNGNLYAIVSEFPGYDPRIERFDETQNKFVKITTLPQFMYEGAAALNGKIYCFAKVTEGDPYVGDQIFHTRIDIYDIATNTWNSIMKENFELGHNCAITVNGNIYVFGNKNNPFIYNFDPATLSFVPIADLPSYIIGSYSISELNGKIYFTGGYEYIDESKTTVKATKSVYVFDTNTMTWSQKADMPTARYIHASCVYKGKIFVMGGYDESNFNILKSVEIYDPTTDTWSAGQNLLTGRVYLAAQTFKDNIYAVYGCIGLTPYQYYDVYGLRNAKPVQNTWSTKSSLPCPKAQLAAVTCNNKIYAIGGYDSDTYTASKTLQEYDLSLNSWSMKADMNIARNSFGAASISNKIYAVGGFNNSFLNSMEMYDPTSNSWALKANMPTARHSLAVVAAQGKIYAMGGITNSSVTNVVEAYDPATNTWSTKASMPVAKESFAAEVVNGKIYVMGGTTNQVYEYDPATNVWTEKASMITARKGLTVSAVNGKIYAMGGYANGYKTTVEQYDVATNTWTTKANMLVKRMDLGSTALNGKIFVLGGWYGMNFPTQVDEYIQ